jgi:hypothetical protein
MKFTTTVQVQAQQIVLHYIKNEIYVETLHDVLNTIQYHLCVACCMKSKVCVYIITQTVTQL